MFIFSFRACVPASLCRNDIDISSINCILISHSTRSTLLYRSLIVKLINKNYCSGSRKRKLDYLQMFKSHDVKFSFFSKTMHRYVLQKFKRIRIILTEKRSLYIYRHNIYNKETQRKHKSQNSLQNKF